MPRAAASSHRARGRSGPTSSAYLGEDGQRVRVGDQIPDDLLRVVVAPLGQLKQRLGTERAP